MNMRSLTLLGLFLLTAACGDEAATPTGLPALGVADGVTVSGISSGAYMATQYHVAYSGEVDGAGLLAGGPWGCAAGQLERALGPCIGGEGLDVAELVAAARELSNGGALDDLAGLATDRIYLFHGSADTVVAAAVTAAAAEFYRAVAPGIDIAVVDDVPAAHGWPALDADVPCGEVREPFVNDCDYDAAGDMLGHLYPDLAERVEVAASPERFSQQPYGGSGLAEEGLLYVPPGCRERAGCRLHVAFHGCRQTATQVGTAFAEQSGLLQHAAANDLVVLLPQVAPSSMAPLNPLGCWDWWGYGGADYLERNGSQLAAVRAMIERLQER